MEPNLIQMYAIFFTKVEFQPLVLEVLLCIKKKGMGVLINMPEDR